MYWCFHYHTSIFNELWNLNQMRYWAQTYSPYWKCVLSFNEHNFMLHFLTGKQMLISVFLYVWRMHRLVKYRRQAKDRNMIRSSIVTGSYEMSLMWYDRSKSDCWTLYVNMCHLYNYHLKTTLITLWYTCFKSWKKVFFP